MKAIVQTKFGSPDVLELKEVAKPTPKANEAHRHYETGHAKGRVVISIE